MSVRMLLLAAVTLVQAGCGGASSSEEQGWGMICNPDTDRVGTYSVEYQPVSGGCDAISETWDSMLPPDPTAPCSLVLPPQWRDGFCTVQWQARCDWGGGAIAESTVVTTQQTEDGSQISGEVQSHGEGDPTGAPDFTCSFRLTATRQ